MKTVLGVLVALIAVALSSMSAKAQGWCCGELYTEIQRCSSTPPCTPQGYEVHACRSGGGTPEGGWAQVFGCGGANNECGTIVNYPTVQCSNTPNKAGSAVGTEARLAAIGAEARLAWVRNCHGDYVATKLILRLHS